MRLIQLSLLELIFFIGVQCSGIAKLSLQKIVPIQSGYYNKLSFNSENFWDEDSSHTMTQDGELILQLLYPYDSSLFDLYLFDQQNTDGYKKYEENVKSIKKQRSCVEAKPLNIPNDNFWLKSNKTVFDLSALDNKMLVIDNTKYPCNNGSYYPLIQLHYEYSITLNFEYSYYYAYKSVILIGVLLILIYVSGIIIFYFRQRKQRKKLLKKQQDENQIFEEKDIQQELNGINNDNITSEFQSDKSVVNSLASFSAGFQKSYNQKSFFQNSLQMSQNLTSRAANTNSGKSNTQQSQFASIGDESNKFNKLSKNVDSRRDTGNNRSIYDDNKMQDNSFNGFNESSFNSDQQQFSFADKIQNKQFNTNNSFSKGSSANIKSNNNINYYQNEEQLYKIQEEDLHPSSPYINTLQFK